LCSETQKKKAGSFVSVKHGKRAGQTKELVKEGAMQNSSILAGTGEPQTLQVCRGNNLHKDNDGWANCTPLSTDLLYTNIGFAYEGKTIE
jgi:hypothetical protein